MPRSPEQRWSEEHRKQFVDHYGTMRGFIRQRVTRQNLSDSLGNFWVFPHRIIDIGGGIGDDARWLADRHQEVVLVDTDPDSIDEALRFRYPSLQETMVGDSAAALERFGPESFDLVLSHGVLLYLDKPDDEIQRLARFTKPGGYVSLLTAGKFGKRQRLEKNGRSAAALKLDITGKYTNNLGLEARAYLPQEVGDMLNQSGMNVVDWFGVRIFSDDDRREIESVPAFHRNRLLSQELSGSKDPALKPSAQLLHFIAQKNT